MNKIKIIFILTICILYLIGCSKSSQEYSAVDNSYIPENTNISNPISDDTNLSNTGSENALNQSQSKILIAYFSRIGNTDLPENVDASTSASINLKNDSYVGNTGVIAEFINKSIGGDLFLIRTSESYPVDYDETVSQAQTEANTKEKPTLVSKIENIDSYDIIFIGFPNWWYDMPMAVYSFLEEYDLSGKTIVPFCTSGGSQFSDTLETIKKLQPNSELLEGIAIRDNRVNDSQYEIEDWLNKINISK